MKAKKASKRRMAKQFVIRHNGIVYEPKTREELLDLAIEITITERRAVFFDVNRATVDELIDDIFTAPHTEVLRKTNWR